MAGITGATDLGDALDVITAVMFDAPRKALEEYRSRLDRRITAAKVSSGQFDRRTWGMQPDQIAATQRLMGTLGNPGR